MTRRIRNDGDDDDECRRLRARQGRAGRVDGLVADSWCIVMTAAAVVVVVVVVVVMICSRL